MRSAKARYLPSGEIDALVTGSFSGLPVKRRSVNRTEENGSGQGNAPMTASAGNRSAFLRHSIDGDEKAVAATRDSFDEARIFGGITQCAAQALDGGIQAVVEVHEGVRRPQLAAQLFPGDHLTGPFEKECQELERLVLGV